MATEVKKTNCKSLKLPMEVTLQCTLYMSLVEEGVADSYLWQYFPGIDKMILSESFIVNRTIKFHPVRWLYRQ